MGAVTGWRQAGNNQRRVAKPSPPTAALMYHGHVAMTSRRLLRLRPMHFSPTCSPLFSRAFRLVFWCAPQQIPVEEARLYKADFTSAFALAYSVLAISALPSAAWHSARLSQALAEVGYRAVLRAKTFSAGRLPRLLRIA
ncbi:hypothetical protein D3C81_1327870 [compost metagenome]